MAPMNTQHPHQAYTPPSAKHHSTPKCFCAPRKFVVPAHACHSSQLQLWISTCPLQLTTLLPLLISSPDQLWADALCQRPTSRPPFLLSFCFTKVCPLWLYSPPHVIPHYPFSSAAFPPCGWSPLHLGHAAITPLPMYHNWLYWRFPFIANLPSSPFR